MDTKKRVNFVGGELDGHIKVIDIEHRYHRIYRYIESKKDSTIDYRATYKQIEEIYKIEKYTNRMNNTFYIGILYDTRN